MKRVSLLCVAAAAAAIMVPSARADLFNISFNGGPVGFSGSGVFNALNDGGGVFTVQGVLSGTVTDPFSGNSSITAVSSFAGADNELFFPSTTYFDLNGLSFNLTNGLSVNLFFDGFSENELRSDGEAELVSVTVTPAATPEPSSFVLLGSAALLGAGDLLRRRRTAAS